MSIVTRFAPSPTGYLHLGHAYSAWFGWQKARAAGGAFLLRLEDIDPARCKPEFAAGILEDLRWLGLHWDGEVRVQSGHLPEYAAALAALQAQDLLYPCFCSRAEIAQAVAAPHGTASVYPGICRDLSKAERAARLAAGDKYALRLDVARARRGLTGLRFYEENQGWIEAEPARLGDAVLARKDAATSYHLCVVYDDARQGVTHVTRGMDLMEATHLHVLLQRRLGLPAPVYAHHRLVTNANGKRLAKRESALTLRSMRLAGEAAVPVLKRIRQAG